MLILQVVALALGMFSMPAPFGSFSAIPIATTAQWTAARSAMLAPVDAPAVSWSEVVELNRAVNAAITYQTEPDGQDTWQTPAETWERKAGDCEDFAILKYAVLLASGVPESDLLLVIGRIAAATPVVHAILLVRLPEGWRVMDNRFDHLIAPGDYINFTPLKGFSGSRAYLFAVPFRMVAR